MGYSLVQATSKDAKITHPHTCMQVSPAMMTQWLMHCATEPEVAGLIAAAVCPFELSNKSARMPKCSGDQN